MHAVRVLAPFAIALVFSKMVSTMLVFHLYDITPPAWIPCWTFIQIQNLSFLWTLYRSTFLRMFHLLFGGSFNVVFEHL